MCARQVAEEKRINILTLMRELHKNGYELTFSPDVLFTNCVSITLKDANASASKPRQTKILMKIEENCLLDLNGAILETINAMIEDMKHRSDGISESNSALFEDRDASGLIDEQ